MGCNVAHGEPVFWGKEPGVEGFEWFCYGLFDGTLLWIFVSSLLSHRFDKLPKKCKRWASDLKKDIETEGQRYVRSLGTKLEDVVARTSHMATAIEEISDADGNNFENKFRHSGQKIRNKRVKSKKSLLKPRHKK